MNRLIKDGKVAVAVSLGFGAGWSTWEEVHPEDREVALCLYNEDKEGLYNLCEERNIYKGGVEGLTLVWLPIGTKYIIEEYDGSESIYTPDDYDWNIAGEDR